MYRIILCALAALVLAVPATAAKKPHRNAATADFALVGTPVYGGTVGFAGTQDAWVSVECWQDASVVYGPGHTGPASVYGQYWTYDPSYVPNIDPSWDTTIAWGGVFTLWSAIWQPGSPAQCTATLYTVDSNHVQTVLTTLDFTTPSVTQNKE